MARPRTRYEWEVPRDVVSIVRGICADYERREMAIRHSTITGRVLSRYIELNRAVELSLGDIEVGVRLLILDDVAAGRGYAFSPCSAFYSKNTFYERKKKLVFDIAKELSLIP